MPKQIHFIEKLQNQRRVQPGNFVLSISKEPINLTPKFTKISGEEVERVKDWIKLNYDLLMELWEVFETGLGSTIAVLVKLKKLG